MSSRLGPRLAWLVLAGLALALRYVAASRGADDVDSIYYARALDRYSVVELRPYFPGFPLYVGAAWLARRVTRDAFTALHAVSALASAAVLWPLAGVAADWRRWSGGDPGVARRSSFVAALLWAVSPAACLTGTEIASDSLALVAGLSMLWCAGRAITGMEGRWSAAAGVWAGVMLGVRLLHAFLLGPAVAAAWRQARRPGHWTARAALPLGFVAGVAPWLAWQLVHEGRDLLYAGAMQVSAHLATPDHSLARDGAPLRRTGELLASLWVHGLGLWSPRATAATARLIATLAMLPLVWTGVRRLRSAPREVGLLPLLWAAPFALYLVAAQDVTHVRYTLPLAALTILVAALAADGRRRQTVLTAAAAVASAATTLAMGPGHRAVEPTEFQLARSLGVRHGADAALLIVENERMMTAILEACAPGVRPVWSTPDGITGAARALERQGLEVYSTVPAGDHPNEWIPVERFQRPGNRDVHSATELWLFRHMRAAP